ncbi:MAG: extracellular solute-binding protein [Bacilli bacterium]|nr:extracellular solute-binding protein [Bacilli bacterium]
MKTRKINKYLVLGLLTTASLCACQNTSSSSVDTTYRNYDTVTYGDPASLKAAVTFWTINGKNNGDALNTLVAAFNKIYPNIKINITQQGGYSDIETKINNAIPAGTTPTVAYCYPDHVANYLDANAVMDVSGFVDDPTLGFQEADKAVEGCHDEDGKSVYGVNDFVKEYWDEGTAYQKEGTYSVPFCKSTEALFYNKTFFDAYGLSVPETWEEMWSLCAHIKEIAPDKTPLGYDADSNFFISSCEQLGIPYTSSAGDHYLFNNPEAKALMNKLVEYYNDGYFVTKATTANGAYASTKYTEQSIIMFVGSTGGTSYATTDNFDSEVARVPHWANHDLKVIQQGPSLCFFNRGNWADKYGAWLFYKFATRYVNSVYFATASTGYDPVRVSSFESQEYANWLDDNASSTFGKVATMTQDLRDNYFYSPVFVGSSTARTAVGEILANIVQNGLSVDGAFTAAVSECVSAS